MPAKKPNLSAFRVTPPRTSSPREGNPAQIEPPKPKRRPFKTKAFELRPEAIQEFEVLRAETGKKSYELAAEALNLLFAKYERPQIA